jgi:hypothetical protein
LTQQAAYTTTHTMCTSSRVHTYQDSYTYKMRTHTSRRIHTQALRCVHTYQDTYTSRHIHIPGAVYLSVLVCIYLSKTHTPDSRRHDPPGIRNRNRESRSGIDASTNSKKIRWKAGQILNLYRPLFPISIPRARFRFLIPGALDLKIFYQKFIITNLQAR